jgi:dTDP-4-dehydrorhamnose reductase
MKVWVTGAEGILGSALQKALLGRGISFAASSRRHADVTDIDSLENFYWKKGPFTHLIHCAAYTKVDRAEEEPEEAWIVNAQAPEVLGRLAAREGMKMLHLSTDYVFDGTSAKPYTETDLLQPASVYGKTKAEGEAMLLDVLPDACIIRTSWLFGPRGRNFVSTMLDLMRSREMVQVVSDQRGRPTYAPDLAEALIDALDWKGVYHIANSGQTSWYAFALAIRETARAKGILLSCYSVEPISSADFGAVAPRPRFSVLDTSKADLARGKSLRPWKEGLRECMSIYA